MPVVSVTSNIASLRAQHALSRASQSYGNNLEKLSSGLRINHASDDAAGLAIASSLSSDSRVFAKGLKNINDAISFLSIADGAVHELTNIGMRMKELATQSANGVYSDTQRTALQSEVTALQNEYNRIIDTTKFNGIQILNPDSATTLSLQLGYSSLSVTLGGNTVRNGTGTFSLVGTTGTSYTSGEIKIVDLNGDGKADLVKAANNNNIDIFIGGGDGTFKTAVSYNAGVYTSGIDVIDVNSDGQLDIVSGESGRVAILLGNGNGTFKADVSYAITAGGGHSASVVDMDRDGILDIVVNEAATVAILTGNGDGTFKAKVTYFAVGSPSLMSLVTADFNEDGYFDVASTTYGSVTSLFLGNSNGTLKAATAAGSGGYTIATADLNNDGYADIMENDNTYNIFIKLGRGDGTFQAQTSVPGIIGTTTADFDGDGNLDFLGGTPTTIMIAKGNGDGTFRAPTTASNTVPGAGAVGDINGDSILDLVNVPASYVLDFLLGDSTTTVQGIQYLSGSSITTRNNALSLLTSIESTLSNIRSFTGNIGSAQSRVHSAYNTLDVSREGYLAAKSRIMDVDVASESADATKNKILQDVAVSILANANQQPALALELLR